MPKKKSLLLEPHKKTILWLAVTVLVVLLCTVFYLLGDEHALRSLSIKTVTPDQVANAMKNDNFYADYRENTLIVKGTIKSIDKSGNDYIASFVTSSTYDAKCDLGTTTQDLQANQTVSLITEGAAADRQPSTVLLKDCLVK